MGIDYLDEQFPLMPLDDHLVHQTPDPMRVAYTTDPRFFDRHLTIFHDQTGDLIISTGGTFYPNLDSAEAYTLITYKGRQTSIRAFRPIGADRTDLHNGPIRPTILTGLRNWRHQLVENEWGITYDLNWVDTHRQIYNAAYGSIEKSVPRGSQRSTFSAAKIASARMFSNSAIVNDPTGWVKNQLMRAVPSTAVITAGHSPPMRATMTTTVM